MSRVELVPETISRRDLQHRWREFSGKQIRISEERSGVIVDCFAVLREGAKKLVCLMPSAQLQSAAVVNPIFHRWSWAYILPECHVIALSDPALYKAAISAAWFIGGGDADPIHEMAAFVRSLAKDISLPEKDVILYGSSMGGYGALMIASCLDGAMAIAEVPQLDMRRYPVKASISRIEDALLSGLSFSVFADRFPERAHVQARMLKNMRIPPFRIITNTADPAFEEHIEFISSIRGLRGDVGYCGTTELTISAEAVGHRPLAAAYGIAFIRAAIQSGWETVAAESSPLPTPPRDYRALIDEAVTLSSSLKYIRTDAEKKVYENVKALLYRAAAANEAADWPFLKLCSVIKLWTNSFNQEILSAALSALERKPSLEGFIYACRGYLYNLPLGEAEEKIRSLQSVAVDSQVANVANIFLSIIRYEEGDYSGYADLIRRFREEKDPAFNPYIAIPVSTVYVGRGVAVDAYNCDDVAIAQTPLSVARISDPRVSYVVSASCDQKYFSQYAEYLVRSFSETCAPEGGALHLSFVDGDPEYFSAKLLEWGARNVYFAVQRIRSENNVGPIASLLRFSHVYQLISQYKVPVFVMDLDSVIRRPLSSFVQHHREADICSRVLGFGVAPWEKYTGGFALFNPTEASVLAAKNIAYAADSVCVLEEKQWWIDQNCFEAGIRAARSCGADINLVDVYRERDSYCVMPVGTGEAKLFNLKRALADLGAKQ